MFRQSVSRLSFGKQHNRLSRFHFPPTQSFVRNHRLSVCGWRSNCFCCGETKFHQHTDNSKFKLFGEWCYNTTCHSAELFVAAKSDDNTNQCEYLSALF